MRPLAWKTNLLLGAVVLAAGIPIACGAGGDSRSSGSSEGAGAAAGTGGSTSSGEGGDIFTTNSGGQTLKVTCPTYVIDVVNGASSPVDCEALAGGPVAAAWVVDISGIAAVDAEGIVTATGKQGGDITLRAVYNGMTAETKLTVNLKKADNPAGIGQPEQDILKGAVDPDTGIQWTYPYNGTVFPKGLLPPELMWNNGGPDDVYYIHFKGKYIDFETYTKVPPPSRFTADLESWTSLTESGKGGPVNLTVTRMPAGSPTASVVVNHSWTIANGSLRGTVYYWANSIGRVLRIKPGAAAPEDFLAAGGESGCSTCHAVSANGSTLIIGGDIAPSTWDLLQNKSVLSLSTVPGKTMRNWAMPAISPKGDVIVENNAPLPGPPGGSDGMFNALTGQKLLGTGLDGVYLDMPAFAPNGTKLAYVDHNTHGLGIYDFDANTTTVSNVKPLVDWGADPSLNCIAFPSVSPDAKWVVYHRGSWPGSLDTRTGPGWLYLASVEQPGAEARLEQLNGDKYPFAAGDRDRAFNYEPTFAPLNSGGYAWVVFTSRRTYGNRLTADWGNTKQLWVAAIDQNALPGVDPSHPAFWVPGQDLNTWNMRGFWALDPCKQVGQGCGTGSECCNGNCDNGICTDPNANECVKTGNACGPGNECCKPDICINGFCVEDGPD